MKIYRKDRLTHEYGSGSRPYYLLHSTSSQEERLKVKHRISNETVFYLAK